LSPQHRESSGWDGLQLWRVAAITLNKQPRRNAKGWSSSLRVGRGANNPHSKKLACYEPTGEYLFFYGKGNENHELYTVFLCIRKSYQLSRGFYEELERVFDKDSGVNFATSKNLTVKIIMFPHHNIRKYNWTSPDRNTYNHQGCQ
jgi:hypothetical protein